MEYNISPGLQMDKLISFISSTVNRYMYFKKQVISNTYVDRLANQQFVPVALTLNTEHSEGLMVTVSSGHPQAQPGQSHPGRNFNKGHGLLNSRWNSNPLCEMFLSEMDITDLMRIGLSLRPSLKSRTNKDYFLFISYGIENTYICLS